MLISAWKTNKAAHCAALFVDGLAGILPMSRMPASLQAPQSRWLSSMGWIGCVRRLVTAGSSDLCCVRRPDSRVAQRTSKVQCASSMAITAWKGTGSFCKLCATAILHQAVSLQTRANRGTKEWWYGSS